MITVPTPMRAPAPGALTIIQTFNAVMSAIRSTKKKSRHQYLFQSFEEVFDLIVADIEGR